MKLWRLFRWERTRFELGDLRQHVHIWRMSCWESQRPMMEGCKEQSLKARPFHTSVFCMLSIIHQVHFGFVLRFQLNFLFSVTSYFLTWPQEVVEKGVESGAAGGLGSSGRVWLDDWDGSPAWQFMIGWYRVIYVPPGECEEFHMNGE